MTLEEANAIIARLERKYAGLRCREILDQARIAWARANAGGLLNRHQRRAALSRARHGK